MTDVSVLNLLPDLTKLRLPSPAAPQPGHCR
jgi:hypothetical protein